MIKPRAAAPPTTTGKHLGDSMAHSATRHYPVTLHEPISALSVISMLSAVS